MLKRSSKKRVDLNILAKYIVDAGTDDKVVSKAIAEGKNPAAVLLGRLGGLKGGKARAINLSAERRTEIAKYAAQSRWQQKAKEQDKAR